jgi:hypothetical protein
MIQICAWVAVPDLWEVLRGPLAGPYALLAAVGGLLLLGGWFVQSKHDSSHLGGLIAVTTGAGCALVGSGVIREAMRLRRIDITQLAEAHNASLGAGGFFAFVLLLIVNAGLTAWAIRIAIEAVHDPCREPG